MQLKEWMKANRWTMNAMCIETKIARQTIKNAMDKTSDILLKTAMCIHEFTKGEVSYAEMLRTEEKNDKRKYNRHKNKDASPMDLAI